MQKMVQDKNGNNFKVIQWVTPKGKRHTSLTFERMYPVVYITKKKECRVIDDNGEMHLWNSDCFLCSEDLIDDTISEYNR